MKEKTEKEITFENAMTRLEEIVHLLDAGDAPLDDSLSLFEEGVKLVKFCSGKLDSAEQRVNVLVGNEDGQLCEKAFTADAD